VQPVAFPVLTSKASSMPAIVKESTGSIRAETLTDSIVAILVLPVSMSIEALSCVASVISHLSDVPDGAVFVGFKTIGAASEHLLLVSVLHPINISITLFAAIEVEELRVIVIVGEVPVEGLAVVTVVLEDMSASSSTVFTRVTLEERLLS